jgi:hypothetical protein
MEKSIETIWKNGFIEEKNLLIPRINNIYNRKSKNVISRLKRLMNLNIYFVIFLAFSNLFLYWSYEVPIAGLVICISLLFVAITAYKKKKEMMLIEPTDSSYSYVKANYNWIQDAIAKQTKFMKILYPILFMSALAPIIQSIRTGEKTSSYLAESGWHLIYGIPTFGFIIALGVVVLMYIFGERIYRFDINLFYGRIFKKMNALIVEMEELQK